MSIKEFGQGGGGGASTFTGLTDTPGSLANQGGKLVKVKSDATGIEFASGGGGVSDFTDLADGPSTYTGQTLKGIRVNAGETGIEFVTLSDADGDVVGPSSSVTDLNVVVFDGTTGKLVKDGAVTVAGLALVGHNHSGVYSAVNHTHAINGLSDVDTSGVTNGQGLLYSSGDWVAGAVGDVSGPGSSTDNRIATFDGTTGKAIQDGGKAVADLADNAFKTIAVSGQSSVVADGPTDTLTLATGANTSISTTPGTDTITIGVTGVSLSSHSHDLSDLDDVDTGATAGEGLVLGGSGNWEPGPVSTAAFKTITVSGQTSVVADSAADSLELIGGSNVTITTNATNDQITITGTQNASEWTDNSGTIHPSDSSGAQHVVVGATTTAAAHTVLKSDGNAVFNEQGNSVDFRVESNNEAQMLMVDGDTDRVSIGGGGVPQHRLDVDGGGINVNDPSGDGYLRLEGGGNFGGQLRYQAQNKVSFETTGGGKVLTVDAGSGLIDVEGPILVSEVASPSTPASGKGAIFAKSDNKLYFKNDQGTETDLTAGAGGGSGTVTSVDVSGGSTGLTTSGGAVTTSGTITIDGTLNIASGGTGEDTAQEAIDALSAVSGATTGHVLTKASDGKAKWEAAGSGAHKWAENSNGDYYANNGSNGNGTNILIGYNDVNNADIQLNANGSAIFNKRKTSGGHFQVSGDTEEFLIYAKADTDRVGVKTNAPTKDFEVNGDIKATNYYGNGSNLTGISGGGDVAGPSSSTDNRIATFDGTTGKLVQDSGKVVGDFAAAVHSHSYAATNHNHTINSLTVPDGDVSFNSKKLTNLAAPVSNTDGAHKLYVDTAVADLVDSAPAALNTLAELSSALGDDENYASTITTALAGKAATSHNHSAANITSGTLAVARGGTGEVTDQAAIDALTDVSSATTGHVLTKASDGKAKWEASSGGGGSSTLSGLTDTAVSGAAGGQVLVYDGSNSWDNKTIGGDITLSSTGAATIGAGVVENSMLDNSSVTVTAGSALTGGGSVTLGGSTTLNVGVDDATIEVSSDALRLKADGIKDTHIDWGTTSGQVSTQDIPEHTNLYYTDARVQTKLDAHSPNAHSHDLTGLSDTVTTGRAAGHVLIYDGTNSWDTKALTGDVTITSGGVTMVVDGSHNHDAANINVGTMAIARGGTGEDTAQEAIDTLSAVSGATTGHVLTKASDGKAKWEASSGGGGSSTLSGLTDTAVSGAAGGQVLVYDGSNSWDNKTVSGDVTMSAGGAVTIASGAVDNAMLSGSIANAKLSNSSVNYGGVSLSLGGSDTTPAFNLADATNYPTTALSGTITNAQLAGSIANTKLANDSVAYGGVSLDLGQSDATPAFNLSDATNYPTSALTGTITNAQLSGSIVNTKLVNDSVSYGGVSLDLGGTDATPAFNLTDATNYPAASLSGTLALNKGGTGATTQQAALDAITGSGTNTHVLTLTGGNAGWAAASGGGGGSSEWTDTGSVLHPTETADSVSLGATSGDANAQLSLTGTQALKAQSSTPTDTAGYGHFFARDVVTAGVSADVLLHFDDDLEDSSGNDNDGTDTGSPSITYVASGAGGAGALGFGKAAVFDGSASTLGGDSLVFIDDPGIGTNDFTVEFWFKSDVATNNVFFSNRSGDYSAGAGYFAMFLGGSNQIRTYYYTGSGTTYKDVSISGFEVDTWYHFALCRSGTSHQYFYGKAGDVSGVRGLSQTHTAYTIGTPSDPWVFGRLRDGTNSGNVGYNFEGQIDEFLISDEVLYSGSTYALPVLPHSIVSTSVTHVFARNSLGGEVKIV